MGKKLLSFTPDGKGITVRRYKTILWTKTLMNKLYDYSYALFQKSTAILEDDYSISLLMYTILKTKLKYKSVTDLIQTWYDLIVSIKKHRVKDWEVDLFSRFVTGQFSLMTYYWFVLSRSLLVQTKERRKSDQAKVNTYSSSFERDLDLGVDYSHSITIETASVILVTLMKREYVSPEIFAKQIPVKDHTKCAFEFLLKKFLDCIFTRDNRVMIQYNQLLQFLTEIKKCDIEQLMHEINTILQQQNEIDVILEAEKVVSEDLVEQVCDRIVPHERSETKSERAETERIQLETNVRTRQLDEVNISKLLDNLTDIPSETPQKILTDQNSSDLELILLKKEPEVNEPTKIYQTSTEVTQFHSDKVLIIDEQPTRYETEQGVEYSEEENFEYITNWQSIIENAQWKAELIDLVASIRAEFELEQATESSADL